MSERQIAENDAWDDGSTSMVLSQVYEERAAQEDKWGRQDHPNGTSAVYGKTASYYRDLCDGKHHAGEGSYLDILLEEVYEAAAEEDPLRLRVELIQVAAVAVAWVEKIDRDATPIPPESSTTP